MIDLFELLTIHLDEMLSLLQNFESTKVLQEQRQTLNQYNYLQNTPVRLGRKSMVTGLLIPRPPSMDASFSVEMCLYLDSFDRTCNIPLFKRGNFHKCTENNESQALAYVNKDTNKIHFVTKIRKHQNVDETQVISDEPITSKVWHSLLFLRVFGSNGKDRLDIILDGKVFSSSTDKLNSEKLNSVMNSAEISTKRNSSFLPLYLGLPPCPPSLYCFIDCFDNI